MPTGAPPQPGAVGRRWVAFALLAVGVVALHGWLLRSPWLGWGRPLVRPGPQAPAPAMQVVSVPLRPRAVLPAAMAPESPARPAAAESLREPLAGRVDAAKSSGVPAAPQGTLPARAGDGGEAPPAPPDTSDASAKRLAPDVAPMAAAPDTQTAAPAGSAPAADAIMAAAEQAEAGRPPPVYETRPPPARTLRYRAERAGATGTAVLAWDPAATGYTLQLQATLPTGPQIDWRSQGGFDSAGLAPLRMVERQKQRDQHAVNFQRDKGVISFSGPSREVALWRGAQDRLSGLIQLSAIAQARPAAAVGDVVRMQVATPRGDVDEWVFTLESTEPLETAGMRWAAQKWVREPVRPYDQRVEVWLAPAAGHLPLGLRWITVPGGMPLALWLVEGLRAEL